MFETTSLDKPVLNNMDKVPCSNKQQAVQAGFEHKQYKDHMPDVLTTTHCTMVQSQSLVYGLLITLVAPSYILGYFFPATNNSQKGSHKDKRDVLNYEADIF